jgi:hypothetical protein
MVRVSTRPWPTERSLPGDTASNDDELATFASKSRNWARWSAGMRLLKYGPGPGSAPAQEVETVNFTRLSVTAVHSIHSEPTETRCPCLQETS